MTLSLTTDVWSRVHVAAFVLIATSGFVSLSGMASLYASERSGAAWDVALSRVDMALLVGPALAEAARTTGAALPLAGVRQVVMSSVVVVRRVGYRPALLLGLTLGLSVGYTALAAGLLVLSACRWTSRRQRPAAAMVAPATAAAAVPAAGGGSARGVGVGRPRGPWWRGPAVGAPTAANPPSVWCTGEEVPDGATK